MAIERISIVLGIHDAVYLNFYSDYLRLKAPVSGQPMSARPAGVHVVRPPGWNPSLNVESSWLPINDIFKKRTTVFLPQRVKGGYVEGPLRARWCPLLDSNGQELLRTPGVRHVACL